MRGRGLVVGGLLLAAAMPVQAATRDDIYRSLQRCDVIKDNRGWLNCLYGAVQPMRAELALPPAPDSQVRLVPQTGSALPAPRPAARPKPEEDDFLSRFIGGKKSGETLLFKAYRFGGDGRFTVTLGNGEIWQQSEDDNRLAHWKAAPDRYFATISYGQAGAGVLKIRGEAGTYRVRKLS